MLADGLRVEFGRGTGRRVVLDGLDLTAEPGRVTALLGANGAGKTTFLRACTGLIMPTAGRIEILGLPPRAAATSGRIGMMPQSAGAWSGIRARELLGYLAGLYADPLSPDALLDRLMIADAARTEYRRLSGGQQQAVNLAGAIIGRPELVFLDEPTAGMDPVARHNTWSLIGELAGAGVTIVITTHAMDEAERLSDRVVIVDAGRTVAAGTVADLTAGGRSLEDVFLSVARAGRYAGAGVAPDRGHAGEESRS